MNVTNQQIFNLVVFTLSFIGFVALLRNVNEKKYGNGYSTHHRKNESGIYVKLVNSSSGITQDIVVLCKNGDVFSDLETCQNNCSSNVEFVNDTQFEPGFTLETVKYKVVVFEEEEYVVNPNTGLLTILVNVPLVNFGYSEYFLIGKYAHVCYPLNPKLNSCFKQTLSVDDDIIKLYNNDRVLRIEDDIKGQILTIGDFFPSVNGTMKTCMNFSTIAVIRIIGFVISDVSLAITFALCLLLTEIRKKIKVELLMHVAMMFVGFSCLTIKYTTPGNLLAYMCPTLAFLQQFSFLSSFGWLNVLIYSLYRSLTKLNAYQTGELTFQRFFNGCLYGFGVPILITTLTLVAELTNVPSPLFPYFTRLCWFRQYQLTGVIYYYGPMAVSILVNGIYLIKISIRMKKLAREIVSVNKNAHMKVIIIIGRLIFVVGFWSVTVLFVQLSGKLEEVWYYVDAINTFNGFFIFVAYVCNKTVFLALWDRANSNSCCRQCCPERKQRHKSSRFVESTHSIATISLTSKWKWNRKINSDKEYISRSESSNINIHM